MRTAGVAIHPLGVSGYPTRYAAMQRTSQFAMAAIEFVTTSSANFSGCGIIRTPCECSSI